MLAGNGQARRRDSDARFFREATMTRRRGLLPFFASLVILISLPACGVRGASAGQVATASADGSRPALARQAGTTAHSISVGGRERTYALHLPPAVSTGTALPLVLVFHGGGGQGKQ